MGIRTLEKGVKIDVVPVRLLVRIGKDRIFESKRLGLYNSYPLNRLEKQLEIQGGK